MSLKRYSAVVILATALIGTATLVGVLVIRSTSDGIHGEVRPSDGSGRPGLEGRGDHDADSPSGEGQPPESDPLVEYLREALPTTSSAHWDNPQWALQFVKECPAPRRDIIALALQAGEFDEPLGAILTSCMRFESDATARAAYAESIIDALVAAQTRQDRHVLRGLIWLGHLRGSIEPAALAPLCDLALGRVEEGEYRMAIAHHLLRLGLCRAELPRMIWRFMEEAEPDELKGQSYYLATKEVLSLMAPFADQMPEQLLLRLEQTHTGHGAVAALELRLARTDAEAGRIAELLLRSARFSSGDAYGRMVVAYVSHFGEPALLHLPAVLRAKPIVTRLLRPILDADLLQYKAAEIADLIESGVVGWDESGKVLIRGV